MDHIRYICRAASVMIAIGGSLLGSVLYAPSAFALIVHPVGAGSLPTESPQTAPTVVRHIVTGGVAGWQIALIAVAAALLTATLAVFADRARGTQQKVSVSAA